MGHVRSIILIIALFTLFLSSHAEDADVSELIMEAMGSYEDKQETVETTLKDPKIDYKMVKEYIRKGEYYYNEAKHSKRFAKNFYRKAISLYESVLEVDEKNAYIMFKLGSAYWDSGIKKEKAIPLLEKAVVITPNEAIYWNDLGFMYTKTGDLKKSIRCYLKAIELDEFFDLPYMNIGLDYLNIGMIKEAKNYLEEFTIITKSSAQKERIEDVLRNIDEFIETSE